MSRRLRVGLVGTGNWAEQVHGASAAAHPDVDLVGVWGRQPDRTEAVAAALATRALPSFAALLGEVELLSFAVPPQVQATLVEQAAGRLVGVLLEKPTGLDVGTARRVLRATARMRTAVLLTRSWEPQSRTWLDALAARAGWVSGRVRLVHALGADVLEASPWRAASGALWDVGPHALSLLEAVLGDVVQVRAAAAGPSGSVHLVLEHSAGSVSTAELCLRAVPSAAGTEIAFWGAAGLSGPPPAVGREDAVVAHGRALSSLLSEGPATGPDAAYGLHVTEVLTDAERALRGAGATAGRGLGRGRLVTASAPTYDR
ncbi:MAG: oxidoreductase [Frankiales bacterium]|nr:oxidoreductase [Frankiales bacterium]